MGVQQEPAAIQQSLLQAAWRGEVLDVIARYAHCVDCGDFDVLEGLFADDAVFDVSPKPEIVDVPARGRGRIRRSIERRYAEFAPEAQRRHIMTTTVFDELDETRAATRTFLVVLSAPRSGGPAELRGTGVYHDRFVRSGERWQFSNRLLELDVLRTA